MGLEGGGGGDVERKMGDGVDEFNIFGVEEKAGGGIAIEIVADDGGIETLWMCAVYPQLMSATRLGI